MERKNDEKHYRFAALADIHIDLENGGQNTYFIYAEENFSRALEIIRERNCDYIISAGDQVTNASGAKEEWRRYREIIDRSGYTGQIFEAMGNHETRYAKYGGCTVADCQREFIRCTRLAEKPVRRPEGKTYYAYTEPMFGDMFLFLSLENGVNTNEIDNFSDEQMDWAEELLGRCIKEDRRVFLIQHAPLLGFGADDDERDPAYEGSIRLTDKIGRPFPNNRRFFRLITSYKNVIWLSGHTHVDLRDNVNYSTGNGRACHMIHLPCLAGTTRLTYDENGRRALDRTFHRHNAQGTIADVYENRVVFSGIDFFNDTTYPEYTYTVYR